MRILMVTTWLAIGLFLPHYAAAAGDGLDASTAQKLDEILVGDHRSAKNQARDQYRHPRETLAFFEIDDAQTVVEVWPGQGWYSEILAPLLKPDGKLYAAHVDINHPEAKPYHKDMLRSFKQKLGAQPDIYGEVIVTALRAPEQVAIAPAGSADRVLTFRSVHNWLKDGNAEQTFAAMFQALKSGGVLGVVEHRARPGTSLQQMIKTGYVTEAEVIRLAQAAGFRFSAKSEVNANANDSTDHPMGVWNLPPALRGDKAERERYLAIGESDRMTLKFIKP